ncbi:glycosyltransferase [Macrococcoides canis]|uniref:glycosyltransferase n=1 Tax=Macrococcoides canis TaxID=1855823 RepID=UPI0020B8EA17|nr:glycosyltransferase [Macrococcus canis]UTH12344.1 glycosyltransferase [Macrococcus canis]
MKTIWIVSDGEPLPIDDVNVRLRRMGNLAEILSEDCKVIWFSSNFQHYTKSFRSSDDTLIEINKNYHIQLLATKGYKKNISVDRIIHYKVLSRKFMNFSHRMDTPDVILCTLAPIDLAKTVMKYSKKYNVKYIIDIRDLWPEIYYDVLPNKVKYLTDILVKKNKLELKSILKNSYSMIGVTSKFLDYGLEIAGIKLRKQDCVIHTAYPINNIESNFCDLWAKYNLKTDDKIITFVGNFSDQFNIEPIFDSLNHLNNQDIKIVLCGVGKNLERYKEIYGKNERIIFPGWINQDEISSLLNNSILGIAPYIDSINYRNNLPNKFGEYLSFGVPILVGVEGMMKELLLLNECGNFYKNSKDLALLIDKYTMDVDFQREQSNAAKKLYDKSFNAAIVYREFANYIKGLCYE